MLPPDDDYLEDRPESNPEPEEAELSAALALIPADFYEQLAPLLQLCAVANFFLLGRAADPVPQAIRQLTGFELATARQVSRLRSTPELGRLLLGEPDKLFDFLLLGQLTFASPLFAAVQEQLPMSAGEDDDLAHALREFVAESSEEIITNLSEYLTLNAPDLNQDWHLRRLQLQSIFARLEEKLLPTRLPQTEQQASSQVAATAPAARLGLPCPAPQRAALQLALALPEQLASDDDEPFARAVAALPNLRSSAAKALRHRLQTTNCQSPETIYLTLHEITLLYQAAQVRALALVSGALDHLTAAPGANSSLITTPEDCAELERFVQLVQATFPAEPALVAARREVEALAELL